MSSSDCFVPDTRRAASCSRQNDVVGCWPVPKLKPGSSTTTAWFFRGRRRLQLGLMRRAGLISSG